MNKTTKNTLLGILAAVIFVGLFIFSVEEKKSIFQIFIGFVFFIIPFSFMSLFTSKVMSFILTSFAIIFGYIVYKLGYYDVWIGIVQAFIIGFSIYYFRIRTTKVFSTKDYEENAKKYRNEQ